MEPFRRLVSPAAVLAEDNVDTDVIFPARFLLITARDGLGHYAFHDRRFTSDGCENADFFLNRAGCGAAQILVAGANFGCGSSREQAVWALLGRGIRCIVAPSFGEIFFGNCVRNGVLPVVLGQASMRVIALAAQAGSPLAIDLEARTVQAGSCSSIRFKIPPDARQALLNGWDETEVIVQGCGQRIADFEARHRVLQPWLFETAP